MYKKTLTILLALVMVLSFAAASQASNGQGKNYKDMFKSKSWKIVKFKDIDSHWAHKEIYKMASCGIIRGYEDKTFRPNAPVSVSEALMMICRAASGQEEFEKTDVSYRKFPDWAQGCLAYALDNGIVDEAELKNLNGNQAAKRWQVAVWVVRAMDLEQSDNLEFGDVNDIPLFARPYVGCMYKYRFMIGDEHKHFRPNKPVTRAEIAAILSRIFDYDWDFKDRDDSEGLQVKSLTPAHRATGVNPDTWELIVEFDEDIVTVDDEADVEDGITIWNVTRGKEVGIEGISISGDTLTVYLGGSLAKDSVYRVTIAGGIIKAKASGEEFAGIKGRDWQFATGDSLVDEELKIEKLSPANGATGVDATRFLRAKFNVDIEAVSGKDLLEAVEVYNVTADKVMAVDEVEIDDNTLIITLENKLETGCEYEVTIKDGYLQSAASGEEFPGQAGDDWCFTT